MFNQRYTQPCIKCFQHAPAYFDKVISFGQNLHPKDYKLHHSFNAGMLTYVQCFQNALAYFATVISLVLNLRPNIVSYTVQLMLEFMGYFKNALANFAMVLSYSHNLWLDNKLRSSMLQW